MKNNLDIPYTSGRLGNHSAGTAHCAGNKHKQAVTGGTFVRSQNGSVLFGVLCIRLAHIDGPGFGCLTEEIASGLDLIGRSTAMKEFFGTVV